MEARRWMIGIAGAVSLMLASSVGLAVNRTWDAGGGGDVGQNLWSIDANWSDNTKPTAADKAYLNSTSASKYGAAFIESPTNAVCSVLTVGNGSGNTGRLTIYDGASLTADGATFLGDNAGHGYMTVSYGATVVLNNYMMLAKTSGSYGNVHVRGNNTSPTTLTGTQIIVGQAAGGDFLHEGATINLSAPLYVGAGGNGTYVLKQRLTSGVPDGDGILTIANPGHNFKVGLGGGTGTFTQMENTTFTHNKTGRQFVVGDTGPGTYNMEGGTLDILGTDTLLDIGRYATGTMHQTGGDISVVFDVQLGYGSTGTYNMDGGTLTARNIIVGTGGSSVPNFNFAGGDIYLDGNVEGFDAANAFFHVTGDAGLYRETYDGIGETHLYYIPEPATIGVLCFGAMLTWARRRK